MSGPSPTPTPQLYTADDVQTLLAGDFGARGIAATVEVGEWDPELHRGEPRVIVDFGDGELGETAAHDSPGAIWPVAGSTDVARAILDDAQRFVLWIHAPPVGSGEGGAAAGRRATDQLLRQTARAIRRAMAAPFREKARLTWPRKDDPELVGYPGFVRGTLCRVDILLVSPVLDDALATGVVTAAELDASVVIDGNASTPEVITETVS